ncbi:lipopolysaccharide biosynthesis protein [Campylobacter corcagiensis]|uniref:Oligosaccharide flippase family protein n=1 Tax=Campylobacter corcagiensis TaxID=1448857 RepID=A0A7M1LE05_9BACT|nr:oligosaccharide flippase family protein [Campylobacter corcagiensis]QKF65042.1 flippase [Campylobacter corcagiensis]QOQ86807.1 oligosaccharide flippase family protein [Campylobacter corcagiensis]
MSNKNPVIERKEGAILTYVNIFLNTFIMIFYTPFVIKMLGQSEFGLYSLAISIMGYIAIFDFGLGNAVVVFTSKFIAKNQQNKQNILYSTVFVFYICMSFLIIILGVIFLSNIELFFKNSLTLEEIEILKVLVMLLIFNMTFSLPCNVFSSILNAYERFIFMKKISILRSLLTPLFLSVILLLGFKSISMIVSITFLNILYFLTIIIYCKKNINMKIDILKFNFNFLKMVLNYSIFIFIGLIVDQVNWNFGQFIIGSFLGAKEVGVFAIAILFNSMFIMLSTAISGVFLPKISKMISSGANNETLTNEMIRIGRLQGYIIFLILFGFIIFGKDFIKLWVGESYIDAYYLTIIIMIPLSVPLIQNLGLSIMQAKNQYQFKAISTLIGAIISIFLSIYLVKIYGYFGVSFSIASMFFIMNGIAINWYYHKKIKLNMQKFWSEIFKNITPIFLLFLLFLLFSNFIKSDNIVYFAIEILVFMLLYFIVCYKICMNEYEKSLLESILKKIKV